MSPVDNRVFYFLSNNVINKTSKRLDTIIDWNRYYNPFGLLRIWNNVGQKILRGAKDETNKSLLRN